MKTTLGEGLVTSFWDRFFAWLFDRLLLGLFVVLLFWLLRLTPYASISLSLGGFGFYLYCAMFHASSGRTLGKEVMGLTVMNLEGERVTAPRAFLRSAPDLAFIGGSLVWLAFQGPSASEGIEGGWAGLPPLGFFGPSWLTHSFAAWCIGDWLFLVRHPQRRALHDLLAQTIVLYHEPEGN